MKPAAFDYTRATSIEDAIAALSGADAKIIAGGQSLVPMMNFRLVQPQLLVDINHIPGLGEITETDDCLTFGALVRHVQAQNAGRPGQLFPIIPEAMRHVAHQAIRNRGTIGGSLVHADPSAEWPLLATLLDAQMVLRGPDGERCLTADAFFIAPLVTAVEESEILIAVRFPTLLAGAGMAFDEVARRAGDFAIVSAGAVLRLEDGVIAEARLALGGVGDRPVRASAAEEFLTGKPPSPEVFHQAGILAQQGLEPNSDLHASAEYRLHLVCALARRVLGKTASRA
jgi:CO/xanthine dehydrogenase FAD-binding subunit